MRRTLPVAALIATATLVPFAQVDDSSDEPRTYSLHLTEYAIEDERVPGHPLDAGEAVNDIRLVLLEHEESMISAGDQLTVALDDGSVVREVGVVAHAVVTPTDEGVLVRLAYEASHIGGDAGTLPISQMRVDTSFTTALGEPVVVGGSITGPGSYLVARVTE